MKKIKISADVFEEEQVLHQAFASKMGFPAYYGHNWNAWIDCMSCLDEPTVSLSRVTLEKNELLEIEILINNKNEYYKNPTWGMFCSCVASANQRYAERHSNSRLILTESIV